MNSIFESLENLDISEECFNDIMGIVKEIINELYDSTVASSFKKRYNNYAQSSINAQKNLTDENIKKYMKASNKLNRNLDLINKRDKRTGKKLAQDWTPEKRSQALKNASDNYQKAKDNLIRVKNNASAWGSKPYGIDDVDNAEAKARKARKEMHDTAGRYNVVHMLQDRKGNSGNLEAAKSHLEYQRTHDENGYRK